MGAPIILPSRLAGAALEELKQALLPHRQEDVELDGAGVERVTGLGLQLLIVAARAWRQADRRLTVVRPSAPLRDALTRFTFEDDLFEGAVG